MPNLLEFDCRPLVNVTCWEKRQVVQYISKMKVHLLLEKGGTKGKIPFNKQKKTRRKNTTTKRKDINEAIFTLSGLYFNS